MVAVNPASAAAATPAGFATAGAAVVQPAPQGKSAPLVSIASSGAATYVARDGDTVSQLAIALLGSDTRPHRDAVVAANLSLQSNPDRVLTGQAYSIGASPAAAEANDVDDQQLDGRPTAATAITASAPAAPAAAAPAAAAAGAPEQPSAPMPATAANVGPKLTYTAQPGDTVRALASAFLGGDTKLNRDAIIDRNASLQEDPDRMVTGKRYTIPAPDGLSANPAAPRAKAPTTQPDADEVARLWAGRSLRYTAVSGDTVAALAATLLGSDTPANRDLIIQTNPSLKLDPNHLRAGQTYWIPAPIAAPAK
jgi:pilus assembly protein FimV